LEPSWIAAIALIGVNIFGWGTIFGKLNGQVKSLEETMERHERVLNNGIVQELSELKSQVANLEGTVKTYIDLTKRE
jgi:hypothetical protein